MAWRPCLLKAQRDALPHTPRARAGADAVSDHAPTAHGGQERSPRTRDGVSPPHWGPTRPGERPLRVHKRVTLLPSSGRLASDPAALTEAAVACGARGPGLPGRTPRALFGEAIDRERYTTPGQPLGRPTCHTYSALRAWRPGPLWPRPGAGSAHARRQAGGPCRPLCPSRPVPAVPREPTSRGAVQDACWTSQTTQRPRPPSALYRRWSSAWLSDQRC
jgi:hypothetical protein